MKFELILAVDSGDGQVASSLTSGRVICASGTVVISTQQRRHCGQCGMKRAIKDFPSA